MIILVFYVTSVTWHGKNSITLKQHTFGVSVLLKEGIDWLYEMKL